MNNCAPPWTRFSSQRPPSIPRKRASGRRGRRFDGRHYFLTTDPVNQPECLELAMPISLNDALLLEINAAALTDAA
jgi:hypothetical protein